MKSETDVLSGKAFIWLVELLFVIYMPIKLFGWRIGLLVASGLTSLLHICILLKAILKMLAKDYEG